MNLLETIFLGVLQGLTEFLPVSSSGHLFLAQTWLGFEPSLSLEIWFHVASLLAVIAVFWRRIVQIFRGFFLRNADGDLGWKLIVATLFTMPVGFFMHKFFDQELNLNLVGITLLATAGFIVLAEKGRSKCPHPTPLPGGEGTDFSWKLAILLGLVQGIAVLPGISRSGITIAFLILLGLNRKKSAEISFLLAIPTILGALVYSLSEKSADFFDLNIFIGLIATFIASILGMRWMIKLVEKRWIWFAPYCAGLGAIILTFL